MLVLQKISGKHCPSQGPLPPALPPWPRVRQPVSRSAGQPVSRSAGQPVSRSAGQPVSHQPVSRSVSRGPDSRGPDSRGPDSRGPDSRGPDSRGQCGQCGLRILNWCWVLSVVGSVGYPFSIANMTYSCGSCGQWVFSCVSIYGVGYRRGFVGHVGYVVIELISLDPYLRSPISNCLLT